MALVPSLGCLAPMYALGVAPRDDPGTWLKEGFVNGNLKLSTPALWQCRGVRLDCEGEAPPELELKEKA
jgi:hypothetical protein